MAKILTVTHTEFTVSDMDCTVAFWEMLGAKKIEEGYNNNDTMGISVLGKENHPHAEFKVVKLELGGHVIELFQFLDPVTKPFHKDPSIAGNAHLAFLVDDLKEYVSELSEKGVKFLSEINADEKDGIPQVLWCNALDPDGIVVELQQTI